MSENRLSDFEVLSFDCYGTLIDWETGIYEALAPLRARLDPDLDRDAVLETYARLEAQQEADTPELLYSDILSMAYQLLSDEWGVATSEQEAAAFGASVKDWPAFPDSPDALHYLKQHFALVVLSNVDHLSFASSQARLGVDFDGLLLAEDIGTYKPDPRNFELLLQQLELRGHTPNQLLHVAQSKFHDHVPAKSLGLATCWIDRRHAQLGWGATPPPPEDIEVDFRFTSMEAFAATHRAELR